MMVNEKTRPRGDATLKTKTLQLKIWTAKKEITLKEQRTYFL